MSPARRLVGLLRNPAGVERLGTDDWTEVLTVARAESLLPTLAARLANSSVPQAVRRILDDAAGAARQAHVTALWEVEMARRALEPLGIDFVLLKGSAYVAAGLQAGIGRQLGDLDILVGIDAIDVAEQALISAGWERVKPDAYDDLYYRKWMHELPPLIHRDRDRMIDVHHTILPLTARRRPDAEALIRSAVTLPNGLRILCPEDMIVHSAAHLFADGELAGGLRNLWDIACLLREYDAPGFRASLAEHACRHELSDAVARAIRLSAALYDTPMDEHFDRRSGLSDRLFIRRMLGRNGWGQEIRPLLRFAFYVRGHLMRMPPMMLARHLLIKARR